MLEQSKSELTPDDLAILEGLGWVRCTGQTPAGIKVYELTTRGINAFTPPVGVHEYEHKEQRACGT